MNRIAKVIAITVLTVSCAAAISQSYTGPTASAAGANTQYTGPSSISKMTVKQLLDDGKDDQYVTLTGKLISHGGSKNYVFADATGEIKTKISPKYFPANQTINENTVVEITGEFDKNRFGPSKLEVNQIKVIPG
ncbi:NirD/YgiW/YdeI family stress tolerance protein [Glaciimonas sp. Gout2]|uniref:YgiW/YdeI family stress tolerance OB fold protein n=1 Tax=unclassified Glaciimonas TaxID=2644401 RepID=UPI002AB57987|nr:MULTISPECIES: NirD/YgiW/YdeI family stress tolerance protein [unclassified Glaciimonas]MDY7548395.1 NirD/YgiW/YdeI family stress tolerance protein [Glaciimonas sp. CA11.2]MEB0010455.1 NirD/YgiW/YdeI family stress tolerance protein [Glaciimonas sp. Cout2]MEB0084000.1 NirD/YgiW/YdeI family stress tolerance protein [Glaciimonas sp. Gout2]